MWGELLWLRDMAHCSWETELKPSGGLQQLQIMLLNQEPLSHPLRVQRVAKAGPTTLPLSGPSGGAWPSNLQPNYQFSPTPWKLTVRMLFIHVCRFTEYRFQQEIWQGHSSVCEVGAAVIFFRLYEEKCNIWGCIFVLRILNMLGMQVVQGPAHPKQNTFFLFLLLLHADSFIVLFRFWSGFGISASSQMERIQIYDVPYLTNWRQANVQTHSESNTDGGIRGEPLSCALKWGPDEEFIF